MPFELKLKNHATKFQLQLYDNFIRTVHIVTFNMTKTETKQIKGIAIIFMLLLHLFNTYDYHNIYVPYLLINGTPLTFYISLFADCCVVLFLYCSGYGLYFSYKKNKTTEQYIKKFPSKLKDLYLKYWIILILFCLIVGPLLGENHYPGNWQTIILNLTAIETSYNGAWWFFTTYVLCLLISPILFKLIDQYRPIPILTLFFVIYTVSYIQRFKMPLLVSNPILEWLISETSLLGNSLLPFVIGAYFIKYNLLNVIKTWLEENFNRLAINALMLLSFLAMFFYMIFPTFKYYVYYFDDPVIIFSTLLLISLVFSYFVISIENFINTKFIKVNVQCSK